MTYIDLTIPEYSYFFGFAQTDGHLRDNTRNRGSLAIELNERDKKLLEQFSKMFLCHSSLTTRTRNTNFKQNYTSVTWRIFDWDFRKELKSLGYPVGKKSEIVCVPTTYFIEKDYYRGIVDADGSVGTTERGLPFISLTTKSDNIKDGFINYVARITGKAVKTPLRNKRDNIYNIILFKEDAQKLVKELYYNDCLCLERKMLKAQEVLKWVRPTNMKFVVSKDWTKEEELFVINHSMEESCRILQRTKSSIRNKSFKLRHK
jgi:hypothetical protein